MFGLLRNSRFYVLLVSFILSIIFALYSYRVIPQGILQNIRFEQITGFTSVMYLYFSLLIGPFFYQFPSLPYGKEMKHMRRAIGVSAFYFAFLHVYVTFFLQLQGFSGLSFLSNAYLTALGFGVGSFIIMILLTLTSVDLAVEKMGFANWKLLHRLTYLCGLSLLLHVVLVGSHYIDLTSMVSQLTFLAVSFLLFLNARRFDYFLKEKYHFSLDFGVTTWVIMSLFVFGFFFILNPFYSVQNGSLSFGIHAAHIQLAKEVQSQTQPSTTTIPGLDGDRSLRYTVSFNPPDSIQPNQDTTLSFQVYNASNGNPVIAYKSVYTKPAHLIIVDSSLTYFSHIHPVQSGNGFSITTQFPSNGLYHLYLDFQPYGGIEQQIGFSLSVGDTELTGKPTQTPDTKFVKQAGDYSIKLDTHGKLSAAALSLGQQIISFTLFDAKTNKPVTNLKPYLGAFGHLVMIREEDYSYLHVHPNNFTILPESAVGGPTVDFLPIGIYGAFKEGTYRAFAEFNPDGTLITTDFTINVGK